MGHDLDFHPHIIFAQTRNTDASPNRLVVWHVLLEIPYHRAQGLVIDGDMVRVYPVDLRPTLSPGILEAALNVGKR